MLVNRSKLVVIVFLLLVPLLCLAGGVALATRYQQIYGCYNGRLPLRSFNVTIDTSQSQKLIEQLLKFADKNGFSYELSYYSPNGEDFSIWMERKDLEIITRSPFTRGEFEIGFYNYDCVDPTLASEISSLVSDLEGLIGEIPNVTITEEK
jgi:hypothetical protein